MSADDQNEIARLKREVARLQAQLKAQSTPTELTDLRENHELLSNLARYAEDILSDHDIKKKYHFDNATWTRLCTDERFIEKIEAEKVRRMRNGSTHVSERKDYLQKRQPCWGIYSPAKRLARAIKLKPHARSEP